MRKIALLSFTALLCTALAACSGGQDSSGAVSDPVSVAAETSGEMTAVPGAQSTEPDSSPDTAPGTSQTASGTAAASMNGTLPAAEGSFPESGSIPADPSEEDSPELPEDTQIQDDDETEILPYTADSAAPGTTAGSSALPVSPEDTPPPEAVTDNVIELPEIPL